MGKNLYKSPLKFTPAEMAKEQPGFRVIGETVSKESVQVSDDGLPPACPVEKKKTKQRRWLGSYITNKLSNKFSKEITKIADSTDDNAVRAADRERRVIRSGTRLGNRYKQYRNRTADKRLDKHESKKRAKELKRDFKANQHLERYGELPKGEHKRQVRSQKRKLRQKQIRRLCDKSIGKNATDMIAKTAVWIGKLVGRLARWVASSVGLPVLGVVVVVIAIMMGISIFAQLLTTTVIVSMSSYNAEDTAIEQASLMATKLEAELAQEIEQIPSQWKWGHIDEFRNNLDNIDHNPWQLMAYLSVKHPGFDMSLLSPVPYTIEQLHNARYTLDLQEEREIRYRTETYTDPVTGEEYSEEVPYTYYILEVRLHSRSVENVIWDELRASPDGELMEWYQALMETGGARQEFANPFDDDWRGYFSSKYGYRIDPVGGVNLQVHRGLDIPKPEGTPIKAGLTGTVRYSGYDSRLGNYVVLEDGKGATVQYAHCQSVLVSQGDSVVAGSTQVALVGNTGSSSTGSHVHIEVKKDGKYLNPIYAISYESEE